MSDPEDAQPYGDGATEDWTRGYLDSIRDDDAGLTDEDIAARDAGGDVMSDELVVKTDIAVRFHMADGDVLVCHLARGATELKCMGVGGHRRSPCLWVRGQADNVVSLKVMDGVL